MQKECVKGKTYSEKGLSGSALQRAVSDFALLGHVLDRFDGRDHPFDGQKSCQIGRVRRDDDQREEPPNPADDARRGSLCYVA